MTAPDRAAVEAFNLDCEELVEIFADFIGQWDRSHEVITYGLPGHLPQLRIPHLRRVVLALQRLGRERDAALAELGRLEQELMARKREDRNVDRTLALLLMRLGGDVEFSLVEMAAAPRRGEFVTMQNPTTGGTRLAFQAPDDDRAELVTWCRIMCVGPACAKPCDDCRRDSARNAKLPNEIRASVTGARAELGLPPEPGPTS